VMAALLLCPISAACYRVFNIAEGWSRDVTEEIAEAVIERGETEGLSESAKKFVECVLGEILR
jgi:hypothetical protein